MVTIRNMKADDCEEVAQLDTLAFNSYFQSTGRDTRIHHRTQTNLLASLALHPQGCFVAEQDKLAGYIFSRIWGKVGWIGTFGVNPDFHNQGIGKKLMKQAIESLKDAGCVTIGLETMPDSCYNVGLYTKLGFNPSYPTVHLTKSSAPCVSIPSFSLFNKVNDEEAITLVTQLSQSANHRVDYSVEVMNAKEFGWGDTLLFGWPQPYGFAIVRTNSILQGLSQSVCEIICVVIKPKSRSKLGEVLQFLQSYAHINKATQITIPMNAIDSEVIQEVITNGFQITGIMLRMIYRGELICPNGIDMARWAM